MGADAIVCGTRGLGGIHGLLTGSVAADLLRRATVPVIVVPAKAKNRPKSRACQKNVHTGTTPGSSGEANLDFDPEKSVGRDRREEAPLTRS